MPATTIVQTASIAVVDYRCTLGPRDEPFVEQHESHSVSYVRAGSFGCLTRGESHELVTGSILVGHPGDEYMCTHDHVRGDECLSFHLAPAFVESIGARADAWRIGSVPPLPELMVLGELAQAALDGRSDAGADEVGMLLASRFVDTVSGAPRRAVTARPRDRRRAVDAAAWLDAHAPKPSTSRPPRPRPG